MLTTVHELIVDESGRRILKFIDDVKSRGLKNQKPDLRQENVQCQWCQGPANCQNTL